MSHEIGRHKLFWARYSITFYDFYPDFYEIGNGSGGTSFHLLRRNCIYSWNDQELVRIEIWLHP